MSAVERHDNTTTALSIADDQTEFNQNQVSVLNQLGVTNASRGDLAVFFHQVKRTGLDPFAKQIYMINRQGKQTIQTGIDGFRLIARRATDRAGGALGYEDTLWCGPDGQWVDVWLSNNPPMAAKVTVIRNGERFPATALLSEYVGLRFNKSTKQQEPNTMWRTKPALMLAKCAEALALRKAFPQDLSGIYTSDEMQQADNQNYVVQQTPPASERPRDYWNAGKAPERTRQQWVAAFTQQLLSAENTHDADKLQQLLEYVQKHSDGELVRMTQTTMNRMKENAPAPEEKSSEEVFEGEIVEPEEV